MANNSKFDLFKLSVLLRLYGLFKIPLVWFLRPSIVSSTEQGVVLKIPLIRRTKNHMNSMYFGALASGADLAAGFIAINTIKKSGHKVSMLFKSMNAEFLKRVEGDAHFECMQAHDIERAIQSTVASGERVDVPLTVLVNVPSKLKEPAVRFSMVMSLKRKV